MTNEYNDPNDPTNYWAQQANHNAHTARLSEIEAQRQLEAQKFVNQSNVDLILQLRNNTANTAASVEELRENNEKLESEKQFLENLLSLPMEEIAEKNEKFKETYEAQQLVLAKWILSQKAYAETAFQIGLDSGKSPEEVQNIYKENIASVLANATKYGNDAVTNKVLKDNVSNIIKNNKN